MLTSRNTRTRSPHIKVGPPVGVRGCCPIQFPRVVDSEAVKLKCGLLRFSIYGHVMKGNATGREWLSFTSLIQYLQPLRDLDSGLMAKDKSEKRKRRVSDVASAVVEEDVEMAETKVRNDYGCFENGSNARPRRTSHRRRKNTRL